MRIIAGTFRSRQLKSPKGLTLRPTSDRLRETLFNVLQDRIADSRFVDLFAGTGAIGIEAISRGAKEVIFIENHRPTAELIRKNLDLLEIRSGARVLPIDAIRGLQKLAAEQSADSLAFDIIFLDPPYAAAYEYEQILAFLGDTPVLNSGGGLVIAEHRRSFDLPETQGRLHAARILQQGDASLTFYTSGPREVHHSQ
jgi:16S rRNA (guanine966-N2)-methyltransferase